MLDLAPDRLELPFDHAGRQLEAVRIGELVEQRALEPVARDALVLALDLAPDGRLEGVEVVEPDMLGELVVDERVVRVPEFLDGDREARLLALELVVRIVLREVDLDGLPVAGFHAEELFLEARDELARAQPQHEVLGGAALEGLAVDAADEVDRDLVAVLRFGAVVRRAEMPVLLGQAADRLVDLVVLRPDDHAFELERGEVDRLDLGHELEVERVFEVRAVLELEVADLRLHRRADPLVLDRARGGVLDRRLEDLALDRVAEAGAQHGERHLAGAEAGHPHLAADLVEPRHQLAFDVGGGDADPVLALEPFGADLGNLHACLVVGGRGAGGHGAGGGTRTPKACATGS